MKLSKSSLPFLSIGVLFLALVGLGKVYMQQMDEQDQLVQQLMQARQRLSAVKVEPLTAQKQQLEEQLNQINVQALVAKSRLSVVNDSITVNNVLREMAKACNVTITDVGSSSPGAENLAGVAVSSMPVEVKVQGSVSGIIDFIVEFGKKFPTGLVKSAQLTMSPVQGESAGTQTTVTAVVRMVIYVYQGGQR
ncbi:MAG: hypothetical protein Q8O16_04325 [Dehalococcoidia bacterium]|nr:hypothetical protein [Dehalococcoidia bacterium]